jgi:hypothetical protein
MIYTRKKSRDFTTVSNSYLKETELSWKAKGLLTYLLSLPSDWKINMKDLKNRSTEGRDATMNAMKELIDLGYAKRVERRANGKIEAYDYYVSDEKSLLAEDQLTEDQLTENQLTGDPPLPNTKEPNTKEQNTNPTKGHSFPSGKLYKSAIDVYYRWYEKRFGIKPKIDGVQGSSMKKLLKNIAQISGTKDDQKIIDSLRYIFEYWDYLDQFNQKQVELKNINGNLNNIVVQINQRKNNYVTDNGSFRNFLNL